MKILMCLGFVAMLGCGGSDATPTPDAGTPDAGSTQVGVVDFVTDLVHNHTDETSSPVSIDDLELVDTDDPAAFDYLLGI
jgi:hypothetical protein